MKEKLAENLVDEVKEVDASKVGTNEAPVANDGCAGGAKSKSSVFDAVGAVVAQKVIEVLEKVLKDILIKWHFLKNRAK